MSTINLRNNENMHLEMHLYWTLRQRHVGSVGVLFLAWQGG